MRKDTNHKTFYSCLSLLLAFCLIFSSFSSFFLTDLGSDNSNDCTVVSYSNNYHSTKTLKDDYLLAELIDIEEEDLELRKNVSFLLSKHLRVLWDYSITQDNNSKYIAVLDTFIVPSKEEPYIEYCSLKIPSIS